MRGQHAKQVQACRRVHRLQRSSLSFPSQKPLKLRKLQSELVIVRNRRLIRSRRWHACSIGAIHLSLKLAGAHMQFYPLSQEHSRAQWAGLELGRFCRGDLCELMRLLPWRGELLLRLLALPRALLVELANLDFLWSDDARLLRIPATRWCRVGSRFGRRSSRNRRSRCPSRALGARPGRSGASPIGVCSNGWKSAKLSVWWSSAHLAYGMFTTRAVRHAATAQPTESVQWQRIVVSVHRHGREIKTVRAQRRQIEQVVVVAAAVPTGLVAA